ncbi:DUF6229 family protein [Dyella choica]|uniref:DUF6229 family protein n=1 Tax=Dyella choica TaxID=1927959 RepID=UPI00269E1954
MQQNDNVVSAWLEGADSISGLGNPAGPLFVDGSTEKKMTTRASAERIDTMFRTTQSCASGCSCC